MTFTATEGSSQPIVTSREPIDKPAIYRGAMAIGLDYVDTLHGDGSVTFSLPTPAGPDQEHSVTYHRAPETREPCSSGMVAVVVNADTVVTWKKIGDSN